MARDLQWLEKAVLLISRSLSLLTSVTALYVFIHIAIHLLPVENSSQAFYQFELYKVASKLRIVKGLEEFLFQWVIAGNVPSGHVTDKVLFQGDILVEIVRPSN